MNNVKSEKYGISPSDIEEKSLPSEKFRVLFNYKKIERSKNVSDRLDKYDQRNMHSRKKITWKLGCGWKKSARGKFYKQTIQNIIPFLTKKNCVYNKKYAKNRQKDQLLAKKWRK